MNDTYHIIMEYIRKPDVNSIYSLTHFSMIFKGKFSINYFPTLLAMQCLIIH